MKAVKYYNLPLNSLKDKQQQHEKNKHCAILLSLCRQSVKAKQSTTEYGHRLYLFLPSNKLTFELLTLKVLSESRVMLATSVPILVFLGLSVLNLGPMYATNRQTSDAHHRLMPALYGGGRITITAVLTAWACMHPILHERYHFRQFIRKA